MRQAATILLAAALAAVSAPAFAAGGAVVDRPFDGRSARQPASIVQVRADDYPPYNWQKRNSRDWHDRRDRDRHDYWEHRRDRAQDWNRNYRDRRSNGIYLRFRGD